MKFYLPVLMGHHRYLGELTLVRILTLCQLLPVFPGSHVDSGESGVLSDSITLVPSRIRYSFKTNFSFPLTI